MPEYPVILLPPQIEQARQLVPPIQPFTESAPLHPGKEPQRFQARVLILELVITLVLGLVISPYIIPIGILASMGHIGLMLYQYPRRHRRFVNAMRSYTERLDIYRSKKQEHDRQQQLRQTPERIAAYQTQAILSALTQTIPHDGNNSNAQIGQSEKAFGKVLYRYFGNLIQTRLTLSIPNFPHPYSPDFAYIDQQKNLFIDIEIDEPYTGNPPKAIHYIGKDTRRDEFFLDRGWIIVRFAEQQVVEQPDSCCKVIAELVSDLLNLPPTTSSFSKITPITPVKQWTEDEANAMAKNRFRERYKRP